MNWLLLTLVLGAAPLKERLDTAAIPQELIELFSLHEYRFTGGRYVDEPFHYRLFKPDSNHYPGKRPLIVWLHGAGAIERNQSRHTGHLKHMLLLIKHPELPHEYPFFILAMQMKVNHWYDRHGLPSSAEESDEQMTVLMEVLDEVIDKNDIDTDRIYLTGVSAGGSGCWELALRHPERFAAVAPLASSFDDVSRVDRLVDLPIWAFHSRKDSGTSPEPVRRTVAAISAAGGNTHLTEIDKTLHDCWIEAFQQYRLMEWLLSHNRQTAEGWPPGYVRWTAREWGFHIGIVVGPVIVLGAIFIAIRNEFYRRNRVLQPAPDVTYENYPGVDSNH